MTLEDFSSQSQYVSDADSDGPREITCVPIASQFEPLQLVNAIKETRNRISHLRTKEGYLLTVFPLLLLLKTQIVV